MPSVHSRLRSDSSSGGLDISRSARITPIATPLADIGAHTSLTGSETSAEILVRNLTADVADHFDYLVLA